MADVVATGSASKDSGTWCVEDAVSTGSASKDTGVPEVVKHRKFVSVLCTMCLKLH